MTFCRFLANRRFILNFLKYICSLISLVSMREGEIELIPAKARQAAHGSILVWNWTSAWLDDGATFAYRIARLFQFGKHRSAEMKFQLSVVGVRHDLQQYKSGDHCAVVSSGMWAHQMFGHGNVP